MSATKKRQAELTIEDTFESIPFRQGPAIWLTSDPTRLFLDSWKQLREIYIEHDEYDSFHVDVVSIYRDMTANLRKILDRNSYEPSIVDQAREVLAEIEFWMDELIKEAQRNRNYLADQEDE